MTSPTPAEHGIFPVDMSDEALTHAIEFCETRAFGSGITVHRLHYDTLALMLRESKWRTIETAPATGCQVILYGHWMQFHGTAHESNHVNCGHYANGWVCEGRYNERFIALYWKPMPQPPAIKAEGEMG